MRETRFRPDFVLLLALVTAGCSSMRRAPAPPPTQPASGGGGAKAAHIRPATSEQTATDETVKKASDIAESNAKAERDKWRARGFEEFARHTFKERGQGGKYIVNGDTPILDRKHLKEFYDLNIAAAAPPPRRTELAVLNINGQDAVWNSTQKKQLTYCVSSTFGSRQAKVAADIDAAGKAWAQCANVAFTHVASQDGHCDASDASVVFDVRRVNVDGEYLARSFFPNDPRPARNVLIDESSFHLSPSGKLQLVGILRHELGHTLGLRHEHTRPESGACFEDNDWRPLTTYDEFSVMHYPQCNGGGDWSLTLTPRDRSGIACLYGPAQGFQPDATLCSPLAPPPSSPGHPVTKVFRNQRVATGQDKSYAPLKVKGGTTLEVKMTGHGSSPGDPDLYVRFFGAPDQTARKWDCRPYLEGPDETCSLDVPEDVVEAFIMVHGYDAGRYDVTVKYTPATT
jgi:serine protease